MLSWTILSRGEPSLRPPPKASAECEPHCQHILTFSASFWDAPFRVRRKRPVTAQRHESMYKGIERLLIVKNVADCFLNDAGAMGGYQLHSALSKYTLVQDHTLPPRA